MFYNGDFVREENPEVKKKIKWEIFRVDYEKLYKHEENVKLLLKS